ncbi:MAG: hypothetical protein EAZ08_14145 [Cytophagales bacterium]|nr:MAG: hypothetical protein EAZ08_14145 [Cytophagales bacterium]
MKSWIIIGCSFCFLCGCYGFKTKLIPIRFENNSSLETLLTIDTYVNGRNVKSTTVKRDSLKIYDASAIVDVDPDQELEFRFIMQSTHDTASCKVSSQQIKKLGYIHVNFVKMIFEKGFVVFGRTLDKDSVAHHEFYCEAIDKGGVRIE